MREEENPGNKMVKVFQRNKSPFSNKALKLWILHEYNLMTDGIYLMKLTWNQNIRNINPLLLFSMFTLGASYGYQNDNNNQIPVYHLGPKGGFHLVIFDRDSYSRI